METRNFFFKVSQISWIAVHIMYYPANHFNNLSVFIFLLHADFIPPLENGSSMSVGTVVGVVAAIVAVIVLVLGILLWKGFLRSKDAMDHGICHSIYSYTFMLLLLSIFSSYQLYGIICVLLFLFINVECLVSQRCFTLDAATKNCFAKKLA